MPVIGRPLTLDVAGPRERRAPGMEAGVEQFLPRLVERLTWSSAPRLSRW